MSDQLAELRSEMVALEERTRASQDDVVTRLIQHMIDAKAGEDAAMEARFKETLDGALDKIVRTMEAATAKPIEISAEATEVLLDKILDVGHDQMSSNLDRLDVEVSESKSGIAGSLGKLRALRAGKKK